MASQGVAATSRLAQMQMKFQRKQLEEREQRRLEMTGERNSSIETMAESVNHFGNGKVRQMFDERRRGAGIDRSHPLKPISSTTKTSSMAAPATRGTGSVAARRPAAGLGRAPVNARRVVTRSETFEQTAFGSKVHGDGVNGNGGRTNNSSFDQVDHVDNLNDETFPEVFSTLSLGDTPGDRNNNNNNSIKNNISRIKSSNSIKLKPVLTKKSPVMASSRTLSSAASSNGSASKARPSVPSNSQRKPGTSTPKASQKSSGAKMSVTKMAIKPPPRIVTPPPGMATCKTCNRNFNEDRLAKHEEVCQKMASTRRKIFDASKHRVKGTEAEKYLKKPLKNSTSVKASPISNISASSATSASAGAKKSNWRKKHEEFIAAIRAAKQVKAHLAKGGKLSDLPPPPPSENPDYVQCPHCMRRFNEAAAERHIPKCATMLHNKPKPGAKKR